MTETLIFLAAGTMAAATPIMLAAMGELVVERTGVLNLGVEGMMATGAATGFVVATISGSAIYGLLAAMLLSTAISLVFGVITQLFLANQVASGLAIGIFGLGISALIGHNYEGLTIAPLPDLHIPGLSNIPFFGKAIFSHDLMLYLAIVIVVAVWYTLGKTKLGLIIRAVGESPSAARAIGYNVLLIRFCAIMFGGAMAGLGGAYLSLSYTPLWADGLIAGRGWIAVALVVFGCWRAHRVALGAYLFGAVSLLELSIQGLGLAIPSQFLSATPYIVTIVILAVISRNPRVIRLNSPASLGVTYRSQE